MNFININTIYRVVLIISPIFLLSIRHFTNIVLLTLFIGSCFYLINNNINRFKIKMIHKRLKVIVMLTFAGYFFAVLISQFLRNEYFLPNYDGPLRMLMCAPIFFAISNGWLYNKYGERITILWFKYSFPLMILFTFAYRPSWTSNWGSRITTYFVDPLSFGSIVLLATELTTIALAIYWDKISKYHKLFYVLVVCIGLYLVVFCGSRTGWLATPAILYVFIRYSQKKNEASKKEYIIAILLIILSIIFIYQSQGYVNKFQMMIDEVFEYNFYGMNPDNSVTMRISFIRMGIFYFLENPFLGWGDVGWITKINSPEITNYASEFTRDFAKNGFHNEIITNSVRSGILGLISSTLFLLTPTTIAIYFLNKYLNKKEEVVNISLFLVFVSIHFSINSFATEVTNLIFLASFMGLTYAVTLGEILHDENT